MAMPGQREQGRGEGENRRAGRVVGIFSQDICRRVSPRGVLLPDIRQPGIESNSLLCLWNVTSDCAAISSALCLFGPLSCLDAGCPEDRT